MSVTPHKYWNIRVDGARVPAIVTNIAYQGIIITPGGIVSKWCTGMSWCASGC